MYKYFLLIIPLLNSCILAPFTNPDEQARGERKKECSYFSCQKNAHSKYPPNKSQQNKNFTGDKISLLIQSLDSESDVVRTHASTDLGNLGSLAIKAVPKLETLAKNDPSKWVRRSAVKSLLKIGSPSSYPILNNISKNDSNQYVRESAMNAVSKFKSKSRTQLKGTN